MKLFARADAGGVVAIYKKGGVRKNRNSIKLNKRTGTNSNLLKR